jgi:hypothetical protein
MGGYSQARNGTNNTHSMYKRSNTGDSETRELKKRQKTFHGCSCLANAKECKAVFPADTLAALQCGADLIELHLLLMDGVGSSTGRCRTYSASMPSTGFATGCSATSKSPKSRITARMSLCGTGTGTHELMRDWNGHTRAYAGLQLAGDFQRLVPAA